MSTFVQPSPATQWPQTSQAHPLDGEQPPSWAAALPEGTRADLASVMTGWCGRFWDAADVRVLVRRGLDADEAQALSYRLVCCAIECSEVLADLDALGTDADLMAVATAAGDAR